MDRPHDKIHKEGDAWEVDVYDVDPKVGIVAMHALVATFAAAVAWIDLARRVLR